MARQLQKLELTWIGKGNEPKLEPRILIEDPNKSFGDPKSENMLIHGDNLLALKALEQQYTGQVKCVCMPKGASTEVPDIMLTRYACYLIAQNGDPKKEQIAFAPINLRKTLSRSHDIFSVLYFVKCFFVVIKFCF